MELDSFSTILVLTRWRTTSYFFLKRRGLILTTSVCLSFLSKKRRLYFTKYYDLLGSSSF